MAKKRYKIVVGGRVQDVFFRDNTKLEADKLGLTGYVRNCDDGTVEVVAEGEEEALQGLARYCKHGPTAAKVTEFDLIEAEFEDEFDGFNVKY